ncbi:MAG: hypothetical protein RLZZ412_104 [Verrucomicrobiota bacterium]|jgi:hypothetical protein
MSAPVFHQIDCPKIGSAAAGANEVARYGVNAQPVKVVVASVYFVPDTAVTADDTNNGVITIKAGATTIAALTTDLAQGNLAAGTVYTLTLSGSGADLEVDAGETVSVTKTYAGTGAVMSGLVSLRCAEMRG